MPGCDRCGTVRGFRFRCDDCGRWFCHAHRSPAAHACAEPWPPGRVDEALRELVSGADPTTPDSIVEEVAAALAAGASTDEGSATDETPGDDPGGDEVADEGPTVDASSGEGPVAEGPGVAANAPGAIEAPTDADAVAATTDAVDTAPSAVSARDATPARSPILGRRIPTLGLVLLVVLCSAIGGVALLSTTTGADVPATIGAIEHGRLPFVGGPAAASGPNRTAVERGVIDALNQRRRAAGRAPVTRDAELSAIARAHSEDMAARGYTAHTGPDGDTVADRLGAYQGSCRPDGELVLHTYYDRTIRVGTGTERYTTDSALADGIDRSWARSATHRAAMLDPAWTKAGVGVAVTDDGEVYVTLDLCGSG